MAMFRAPSCAQLLRLTPLTLVMVVVRVAMVLVVMGVKDVGGEKCSHNVKHTVANCSGQELEIVPYGLHHSIDTLDLNNNNFKTLPSVAFKAYTKLKTLGLRNNSISSLDNQALEGLNYLQTLDLANNVLRAVPTQVLSLLPGLLSLNLAGNKLMLIPDQAFLGLTNLKYLDLSGNHIGDVEPKALMGLSKLQMLKLENNALRTLHRRTFEHLSPHILQVHLHNNPWVCDCKIRWLREWLGNGTDSMWQQPGHAIQCHGPSIARGKAIATIPLDELACRVEMRTSGSTQEVEEGGEAVLECIYFSIPYAGPIWQRNEVPINFDARPGKYSLTMEGSPLTTTRLKIKDFQYKDITTYECLAQNVRGSDSTVFKVTLKGIPFSSVSQTSHGGEGGGVASASSGGGIDTKSVVVAVAVVCGIVLLVVGSILVFCCVTYMRRKEQEKRDAVVEHVKKHFLENGDSTPSKEIGGKVAVDPPITKSKLDQFNEDEANSESNRTSDTSSSQAKSQHTVSAQYSQHPHHQRGGSEPDAGFTFNQPSSPFANGNTYVSFCSENDPDLLYPSPPPPSSAHRYDGSQTESTTPLLERYTPSVFDSDDPYMDEYAPGHPYYQHPLYEAATLYHPRRNHFPDLNVSLPPMTPGSTRSTTFIPANSARTPHPDYQDYRELRYPYNSTPQPRISSMAKKSQSVGNLGYLPAPRKPPRFFHSREYVEMSPHDTSGSVSDYASTVTAPVPHQTSYYGIKPGTPV